MSKPVGGTKCTRRRLKKKNVVSRASFLEDLFGTGAFGEAMRRLGYWKSTGPRKPLWRQK